MGIDFDASRWARVKDTYGQWWSGALGRPLISVAVGGRDPGRPEPSLPAHAFTAFYGRSVAPEEIVDRWDWDLSRRWFVGDAFPSIWPNFGAGVVAGFCGADLVCRTDHPTVWFRPLDERQIADLDFAFDPDNPWLRRVQDVCGAAGERWGGLVQVSMTDLGGAVDILSTFRPAERLLLDLYDYPDQVRRLVGQIHDVWFRCFDAIDAVLQRTNPGYTAWTPIFSATPYYMLQCDFCYMISPAMFDAFVRPELAAACGRLDHPFYHLDGPGQLPHLDSLLSIPDLAGVQWIPGAGAPGQRHWPDVYRRIHQAGKLIQLYAENGDLELLDVVADQIGSADGIILIGEVGPDRRDDLEAFLARHGAA